MIDDRVCRSDPARAEPCTRRTSAEWPYCGECTRAILSRATKAAA